MLQNALLVAQGFDWIQAGGAEGWNHAADQSDGAENERGHNQRSGSDDQPNVARLAVFREGAVQRDPADGKRDSVGQDHSQHAADEGDGQSFGKELHQDVAPLRAQRLLHADLAGSLSDRNQHDIHQPDAADSQRKRANESHQDLQSHGDDFELVHLRHQVEYSHRLVSVWLNLCCIARIVRTDCSSCSYSRSLIGEPDRVQVVRIFQIAHGGEGNVDDAVDVVVSLLHLGAQERR